ncbi:hypothetical protein CC86DRAFT_12789 [Ophiobolus disseminans]|uniref:Uncharacterized protein n=1 Tax=Ophiobolus disseminans TaxID=1469910 RepID=A0A6A7AKH0_9PLEO|nr:hypothetical protein CC86DRAFT_12789 [Ophiobolus disseminans]
MLRGGEGKFHVPGYIRGGRSSFCRINDFRPAPPIHTRVTESNFQFPALREVIDCIKRTTTLPSYEIGRSSLPRARRQTTPSVLNKT